MRPSDVKLATALREHGLESLAKRAERGEWNDYFGDYAAPKMALVKELASGDGTEELIARVARGEFDSGRDEAEEWYSSPEGRAMRGLMAEL